MPRCKCGGKISQPQKWAEVELPGRCAFCYLIPAEKIAKEPDMGTDAIGWIPYCLTTKLIEALGV